MTPDPTHCLSEQALEEHQRQLESCRQTADELRGRVEECRDQVAPLQARIEVLTEDRVRLEGAVGSLEEDRQELRKRPQRWVVWVATAGALIGGVAGGYAVGRLLP